MKSIAALDRSEKEGHGDEGPKPGVKKGTFDSPATFAPLSAGKGISPNVKSGPSSGGEQ